MRNQEQDGESFGVLSALTDMMLAKQRLLRTELSQPFSLAVNFPPAGAYLNADRKCIDAPIIPTIWYAIKLGIPARIDVQNVHMMVAGGAAQRGMSMQFLLAYALMLLRCAAKITRFLTIL